MIRALFFDIDGTLVSFKTHRVPSSAIQALKKAKEKGIGIYISTGRPLPLINNLSEIAHLIDGYITTNGAYCFIGNNDVCKYPIPREAVRQVLSYCEHHEATVVVVGDKQVAVHNPSKLYDRIFVDMLGIHVISPDEKVVNTILQTDVLQLTPFINQAQEQELMQLISSVCTSARWQADFIDITAQRADKGHGLKMMAKSLSIHLSETMAFGDGGNDRAIISAAGIGVAMGNAREDVKQYADYVTADIDDDGVAKALIRFGII